MMNGIINRVAVLLTITLIAAGFWSGCRGAEEEGELTTRENVEVPHKPGGETLPEKKPEKEKKNFDMGEANGVSYRAVLTGKPINTERGFEIQRKVGNGYETITEVAIPGFSVAPFSAGVSSDGKYFYLTGVVEESGENAGPFLHVYSFAEPEDRLVEFAYGEEVTRIGSIESLYAFGEDTLYMSLYTEADQTNILYEIGIKPGTVNKIAESEDRICSIRPDERYYVTTYLHPVDATEYRRFKDADVSVGFLTIDNSPCKCHPEKGFWLYRRVDLDSGKTTSPFKASATSTLTEKGKSTGKFGASKAIDRGLSTAWVEGAKGSGVGETLTIDFGVHIPVRSVHIVPGFVKNPKVFMGNNRVKKAKLKFSDGTSFDVGFEDIADLQVFRIKDYIDKVEEITASWMSITILDVYPGDEWDDTCIGEIAINRFGRTGDFQ